MSSTTDAPTTEVVRAVSELAVDEEMTRKFHERLSPKLPPIQIPAALATDIRAYQRISAPVGSVDMTNGPTGRALGQHSIVYGTVYDETGSPFPGALIEIWQVNSAGSYKNDLDDFGAPLDPNFSGVARLLTDSDGNYRLRTIKPAPYGSGLNWRRAHIHFSVTGPDPSTRLITQMYFPGDPVGDFDPCTTTLEGSEIDRRTASYDSHDTAAMATVAYRWDIYLAGRAKPTN